MTRGDDLGPLHGVPCTIKDLAEMAGVPAERGSFITKGEVPDFDTALVTRLKEAGAIPLGKTTTSEFGWKGVSQSPLTGITSPVAGNDALTSGSINLKCPSTIGSDISKIAWIETDSPLATGTLGSERFFTEALLLRDGFLVFAPADSSGGVSSSISPSRSISIVVTRIPDEAFPEYVADTSNAESFVNS